MMKLKAPHFPLIGRKTPLTFLIHPSFSYSPVWRRKLQGAKTKLSVVFSRVYEEKRGQNLLRLSSSSANSDVTRGNKVCSKSYSYLPDSAPEVFLGRLHRRTLCCRGFGYLTGLEHFWKQRVRIGTQSRIRASFRYLTSAQEFDTPSLQYWANWSHWWSSCPSVLTFPTCVGLRLTTQHMCQSQYAGLDLHHWVPWWHADCPMIVW